MTDPSATCDLCREAGGEVLYRHSQLRVVLVDDRLYPGFCRIIWHTHVPEMTDLAAPERELFMRFVWAVEHAVRIVLRPDKLNLASLGNLTPHLHWHVIARHFDDAHFPQPVWGQQQRVPDAAVLAARSALLPQLCRAVSAHCAAIENGVSMV